MDHPTMIENNYNLSPVPDVLQILADKRMFGVEVDSRDRDPPPRCHPETRKNLRNRARIWLSNHERYSRLLYIWGPAGEGKSAVAQSVAEEAKAQGHLGASIFFSKLNDRDDLDCVVPTIVAQLSTVHSEFASIVSNILESDRTILQKNRATQFKELLIDPFQHIMARDPSTALRPLLIVLDGIDECKDQHAQTEFIELVNSHVRTVPRFPLLWIISSRQQAHLKPLLLQLHCEREDLRMDDKESQQDVECVLRDGFRRIYEKYRANFDTHWPPENDLLRIIEVSSGFFAFGSNIIDFVGDSQVHNPESQLKTCMKFLDRRTHVSPLQALDLLYHQILSEIPPESLPTTMRVLGMSILYPHHSLPAQAQANFFSLDRHELIQAFRGLHSVLDVPSALDAHTYSIHFLHTSFADFLKDAERSRGFCIKPAKVHFDIALHALQWHTHATKLAHKELKWIAATEHADIQRERSIMLKVLRAYSSDVAWIACSNVPKDEATALLDELEVFNFRVLLAVPDGIVRFLPWLYSLGPRGQALVHVANPECSPVHSAKTVSAQRSLDRQSKRAYPVSFGSNIFDGEPPYDVVFHLGMDDNTCEFALTLTRDPRSLLQGAAWMAGMLGRGAKRPNQD
ncbi:hypothetical protein AGABI1DRAFT_116487 [Agaricus bisporus var. burnettii JB137-S8]|uniref:NACHT domain-containing protein n=1 Tax=Agaricus bisporus var. burnettii (strain JB137-S8 / ATCC MYA-4627 / FGSC 10392) TaxID=597362 RepID=K5WXH8_AGABU|nr:uncharacterized protein AGABI1DRAFT_116487 [Agaricus bisporus var. burnettii JB137-S8]EKM75287.1 hypothetical protein AGABI1DRAFT_116487 [Agaricus bisporus var. burnettii JB137-S8]